MLNSPLLVGLQQNHGFPCFFGFLALPQQQKLNPFLENEWLPLVPINLMEVVRLALPKLLVALIEIG